MAFQIFTNAHMWVFKVGLQVNCMFQHHMLVTFNDNKNSINEVIYARREAQLLKEDVSVLRKTVKAFEDVVAIHSSSMLYDAFSILSIRLSKLLLDITELQYHLISLGISTISFYRDFT